MEVDVAEKPAARPSPLFNYVVSAQQPTAVTQAVVGNFTAPGDVNLILGCAAWGGRGQSGARRAAPCASAHACGGAPRTMRGVLRPH